MDRARFGTGLLAGVLVGLLAGWILGSLSRSGGRSAPARPLVETEKRVEGADHEARSELSLSSRSSAHEASREPERPEASTPSDGELISDALREHARAGILRGWSKVRGDVMPEGKLPEALGWVERGIHEGPESIGRHFAELQTKAEQPEEPVESEETERVTPDPIEAFLAHDPIELLDRVEERHDTELRLGLVNDAAGFAQLFPGRAARTLDGRASLAKFDAALEDGTVLDFPPGVFRLRRLRTSDSFPRDVTLRGAGMNGTLLLFGDLSTLGELRNFTLRDCTVFNENGPLFDLRARPASVLVERVRLIGFDCGAGGSVLPMPRGWPCWRVPAASRAATAALRGTRTCSAYPVTRCSRVSRTA
jgi:hypothetical protein